MIDDLGKLQQAADAARTRSRGADRITIAVSSLCFEIYGNHGNVFVERRVTFTDQRLSQLNPVMTAVYEIADKLGLPTA